MTELEEAYAWLAHADRDVVGPALNVLRDLDRRLTEIEQRPPGTIQTTILEFERQLKELGERLDEDESAIVDSVKRRNDSDTAAFEGIERALVLINARLAKLDGIEDTSDYFATFLPEALAKIKGGEDSNYEQA